MQYFVTYLIYAAVFARALGWSQDSAPIPQPAWALLIVFGFVLFSERPLSRRLPWYPRLYALVQSGLVVAMLYTAPTVDIFAMLFFPLSFQVVQFFHNRIGFICIGGFTLAMAGMFLFGLEWQSGLTMIVASTGANLLMGSFAHLIERTDQRRADNQRLFRELQAAYLKLKDSAAQSEAFAAAEERYRLVRELHDSLTQTLFSMNLATQAAQLAIQDAPGSAAEQLHRLQFLSRSAAEEVQALTGQRSPGLLVKGGLAEALRQLSRDRLEQDGLQVTLVVQGTRELPQPVQESLYRITQEALTNVIRHAGVREASVRLCLEDPCASLEIEDAGCGFDPDGSFQSSGFGLTGMTQRARRIGWELQIRSRPGGGTLVRATEKAA
jgi:signal transduction histidine kinase